MAQPRCIALSWPLTNPPFGVAPSTFTTVYLQYPTYCTPFATFQSAVEGTHLYRLPVRCILFFSKDTIVVVS